MCQHKTKSLSSRSLHSLESNGDNYPSMLSAIIKISAWAGREHKSGDHQSLGVSQDFLRGDTKVRKTFKV